jgi:hypothetical protein
VTALEREWARRLKASGFEDLEGADRDGPLSDRGNLHAVDHTEGELARLGRRIEDGEAATAQAQAILHARVSDGARRLSFLRSALERKIWEAHAEGKSEATTAGELEITRHSVRQVLAEVRERVSQVREGTKRWRNRKRQEKQQASSLVRRCDPRALAMLAAALLSTQTRRVTARSR